MSIVLTDSEAKEFIAANVSRLLDEREMTQAELARATGENKMMISRVVRGDHVPGSGLLARIAEALGVDTDALLSGPRKKSRVAS